ncbi:MAG: type VII secretion protein EccCa [Dermatophilaceae bacterium]
MSTVVVKRVARRAGPEVKAGEVTLEPPPEIPPPSSQRWMQMLMIVPMIAGAAAMALMMSGRSGGMLMYVAGGLFGVSMLGMILVQIVNQGGGPSKLEMALTRREFMRQLAQQRRAVRSTARDQRRAASYRHPAPDRLWATAASFRLWERRSDDPDFGVLRLGLGPQQLATRIVPPETKPVEDLEPLCALALRQFVSTYSVVPDLPIALSLRGFGRLHLGGDPDRRRALVRALLAQAVTFHSPDDLLVAVCAGRRQRADWEWVKWLPHNQHPTKLDALGPLRLHAATVTGLEAMLEDVLSSRPRFSTATPPPTGQHVIVVLDGGNTAGSDHLMTDGGIAGVTLVDLTSPEPRMVEPESVLLTLSDPVSSGAPTGVDRTGPVGGPTTAGSPGRRGGQDAGGSPGQDDVELVVTTSVGREVMGRPDSLGPESAEALARQLSPLRLSAASRAAGGSLTVALGLTDLLGITDPRALDTAVGWAVRPNRDRLRVPIGVGPDGQPVDLDLKESAQDGMGPHGLLIGATGSGKSELLRTLVLGLAVTHDPETLNLVLVDFKGGATFTQLDRLPHTSAVITNLADELSLVDRMTDAINGELVRRQELLRRAGNFVSQRDYEKARAAGAPLDPLPSLMVVVDEFSELLTAKPDFIDMFVQIGRVGRSLGVHLLLASQRLEEGRLRGLETHLSYRIGLRTFSASESRTVLGVPDAYELPRAPGHGYLKTGTDGLVRLKTSYVSGTYRDTSRPVQQEVSREQIVDFTTAYVADNEAVDSPETDAAEDAASTDDPLAQTLLDVLVGRLEGRGTPAHRVWLPPLDVPPTLDELLPNLQVDRIRGLTATPGARAGSLRTTIGVVDKPLEQQREPLTVDLASASGHFLVVGGPHSGKSTMLRTLICSFALTHTPEEMQFYLLDFGGGSLMSLRGLPHVGSGATRMEADAVRRTVGELSALLAWREHLFASHGIDGMAGYRRAKAEGRFDEDPYGDVCLVVDGWQVLRAQFDDLEPAVAELATTGLSFGIHLLAAAPRTADVRPNVRDMFGTKVELRLGDPLDSMVNRRVAISVPESSPGRGVVPSAHHVLGGLPRIDGTATVDDLSDGVADLVQQVVDGWPGRRAPAVRMLPAMVAADDLPELRTDRRNVVPIGLSGKDLSTAVADFGTDAHLLLLGDLESGKTTFLRTVARQLMARNTPAQARILLVDYRRSLLGEVSQEHLIGYASNREALDDAVRQVCVAMRNRLPGDDVTPEQLRTRSWWTGPELYVLVDDYDLVASSTANPLLPLQEYLSQGRDTGLHVIVTRRSGGAGRAKYEPFLRQLGELGTPAIALSAPKDEGVLVGTVKSSPLPPGRGWLVNRQVGQQLVQLAWSPPVQATVSAEVN